MWVLLTNAGARAGVGPPTGLRRIPATLVVAEQHSLSPESNPSRAPIRRPVAASTLTPLLPPAPQDAVGPLGPRRTPTDDLFETGDVPGGDCPAGHQPLRLKTSGPMKAFSHPHSCREPLFRPQTDENQPERAITDEHMKALPHKAKGHLPR